MPQPPPFLPPPPAAAAPASLLPSLTCALGVLQAECIPRALEGRDVVARARTGSGKTLAYLLPALHRVLAAGKGKAGWQALVLVPTRELCEQVREEAASVASACGADLAVSSLAGDTPLRSACATAAPLVVATPAKLAAALQEGILTPRLLQERLQVRHAAGTAGLPGHPLLRSHRPACRLLCAMRASAHAAASLPTAEPHSSFLPPPAGAGA
jgi:hypothetical protein